MPTAGVQVGDPLETIAEDNAEDEYVVQTFLHDIEHLNDASLADVEVPPHPIYTMHAHTVLIPTPEGKMLELMWNPEAADELTPETETFHADASDSEDPFHGTEAIG